MFRAGLYYLVSFTYRLWLFLFKFTFQLLRLTTAFDTTDEVFFSFRWMTRITGMHEKAWGKSSSTFSLLYIFTNVFSNSRIMLLPTNTKHYIQLSLFHHQSRKCVLVCLQPPTTNFWMWTRSSLLSMSTFPCSAPRTTDGYHIKYVSCDPY